MEMKLGIIRGVLLKGFLSSRKVLPTRSGVSDRKVRDLSNLRKLSYTGKAHMAYPISSDIRREMGNDTDGDSAISRTEHVII